MARGRFFNWALVLITTVSFVAVGCSRSQKPSENEDNDDKMEELVGNSVNYSMAESKPLEKLSTPEKFDSFIKNNEIAVVKFGATWCEPCVAMEAELEKQAGYFQTVASFGKVDVDELGDLVSSFNIETIPDVRVFYEGKEYSSVVGLNPHSVANLVDSMISKDEVKSDQVETVEVAQDEEEIDFGFDEEPQSGDSGEEKSDRAPSKVVMLNSEEEYYSFIDDNALAVVKFGATWCGPCKALSPKLEEMASKYQDAGVAFAEVDVDKLDKLAKRLEVGPIPDVRYFREGTQVSYFIGNIPTEVEAMVAELCGQKPESAEDDAQE